MGKPTTYVLCVTDQSGSMHHLADDVRGGFNSYVDELRAAKERDGGRYRMTVTLFHTSCHELCTAAKLKNVPALTAENYRPGGSTALLDAVGNTIVRFEREVQLTAEDRVLLVIQTDGQENASTEYSWPQIRAMLEEREKTGQWSIVYLGQGVDAWSQGSQFGPAAQVVNTAKSSTAMRATYAGLAAATAEYAAGGDANTVGATVAATPGIDETN